MFVKISKLHQRLVFHLISAYQGCHQQAIFFFPQNFLVYDLFCLKNKIYKHLMLLHNHLKILVLNR
jgi:hypothetical protein